MDKDVSLHPHESMTLNVLNKQFIMNLKTRILSRLCVAATLVCPAAAMAGQDAGAGAVNENVRTRTHEAEAMLAALKALPEQGVFMFGHHDDPMYGIGWVGDADRSDVKSVCGDWPAVMSFDLGHLELGHDKNLDGVPFDRIRKESVAQYERGGMVSFSWHADNPLTGKDAWDVSDSTVVRSVLPGGKNHEKFIGWIDRVADFLNSIKTDDGVKMPVMFRPWHEHTGSWFWWGQALCTDSEYDALWQMTLDRSLRIMTAVSKAHGKPMAVTETGDESVPDAEWWTKTLMPVIGKYPISYVLVWRNAHDKPKHFYAPYPGHASAPDFVKFYNDRRTLFAKDMEKVLKGKKVKK